MIALIITHPMEKFHPAKALFWSKSLILHRVSFEKRKGDTAYGFCIRQSKPPAKPEA